MMGSHYIFENNPLELKEYVYKEVCVEGVDEKKVEGWVHTVDPVSGSICLATFENDKCTELNVIMGSSVKSITVINEDTETHRAHLDQLTASNEPEISEKELQIRKDRVKLWLSKNRIPFQEDSEGKLNIMDALTLEPPYQPNSCSSANAIVLGKIQGLIKAMPADLEEW